ncbi:Uncharacterised protein [Corynebacterium minutissimum]|uniref:Uncharacterized protein n=1 Tax=Corynebacterium minutissimum TaxID=38301 RepID=A0A2X4RUU4_9CORY|nr:Uncharacterised protein [Corynebacterium minutissimum]VEG05863.1 Uncharacterised protein [Corynebacterium minutissimum]
MVWENGERCPAQWSAVAGQRVESGWDLVVVPVSVVSGVAVAIVQVVDVIAVRNGDVAAALAVLVIVILVNVVLGRLALIPVALVLAVDVAIVNVVDVIAVRESDVAAAFTVGVGVFLVDGVGHDFSLVNPCVFSLFSFKCFFIRISIAGVVGVLQ